jgi:hypothetical protein
MLRLLLFRQNPKHSKKGDRAIAAFRILSESDRYTLPENLMNVLLLLHTSTGGGPMRVVGVCLLFCLFFSVNQAAAIPVSFDFSLASENDQYQQGELSLQVSAFSVGAPDPLAVRVTQTADGLGVSSKPGDDAQLENSGPDDLLQFSFSEQVELLQVVFGLVDAGDEFLLAVDGQAAFAPTAIWTDSQLPLVDKIGSYDVSLVGQVFDFSSNDSVDKYRILGMTVDTAGPVPTPEPSTWLLLGSGVCGLLWWRRKAS